MQTLYMKRWKRRGGKMKGEWERYGVCKETDKEEKKRQNDEDKDMG